MEVWFCVGPIVNIYAKVCRIANALKDVGVRPGDSVAIYMPMVPEAAFAMLACARIGAVHSVVFAGFSAEALRDRIRDCGARVLITADEVCSSFREKSVESDSAI